VGVSIEFLPFISLFDIYVSGKDTIVAWSFHFWYFIQIVWNGLVHCDENISSAIFEG
jgi:hypothetical protein